MKEEKEGDDVAARENYSSRSAAAVLMMVFQFAKDNTAIHRQVRHYILLNIKLISGGVP